MMEMPQGFRYRDTFLKGRPRHEGWDAFTIRHPPMPVSKWTKIFAPFDALRGFGELLDSTGRTGISPL